MFQINPRLAVPNKTAIKPEILKTLANWQIND